ncbi:MAG: flippase-like domain-containing protein [archaeon GBS-70-058]|nr:flippase-like domain-containing protein [Candidatus Culexarchaeum nevadense]
MPVKGMISRSMLMVIISYCIGLIIVLALISYAGFYNIIGNIINRISYQLFMLILILNLIGLILYASIWYTLIWGSGAKIRFRNAITSTWASIFIVYLSPTGVAMEVLKLILTNRDGNVPIGKGMAALTMQRILYSISFIIMAVSSYLIVQYRYMIIGEMIGRIITALLAISIGTITTLLMLGEKAEWIEKIIIKVYERYKTNIDKILSKYNSTNIMNSVSSTLNDFKESFMKLKSNKLHLIIAFTLTMINWMTNVAILYLVLLSLGYKVSIWILMVIMVICEFVQMTPIAIPGMLGIIETVIAMALQTFGIPLDIAATASILTRLATFWFDLPVTATAASYYGIKYLMKGMSR